MVTKTPAETFPCRFLAVFKLHPLISSRVLFVFEQLVGAGAHIYISKAKVRKILLTSNHVFYKT